MNDLERILKRPSNDPLNGKTIKLYYKRCNPSKKKYHEWRKKMEPMLGPMPTLEPMPKKKRNHRKKKLRLLK